MSPLLLSPGSVALRAFSGGFAFLTFSPATLPEEILAASKKVFTKWGPLLRRFIKQQDDEVSMYFSVLC